MPVIVWKNISILRGIAMCGVVLVHSLWGSTGVLVNNIDTFSPMDLPVEFFSYIVIGSLGPSCLFAFLFASGFTLARIYQNRRLTWKMALNMLKKYLLWATALLACFSLIHHTFSIPDILTRLLIGNIVQGYWFLVLILVIYILAPFWIYLVKSFPRAIVILMITLQIIDCYLYYSGVLFRFHPIVSALILKPLLFSPSFILGVFLSCNLKKLTGYLVQRRSTLLFLSILSCLLCIGESTYLGYLDSWRSENIRIWTATERVSLVFFFVFTALYIVTRESRENKATRKLSNIGLSSLGILLMMDLFQKLFMYILWHMTSWIHSGSTYAYSGGNGPSWLVDYSMFVLPLFFIVGLFGPLTIIKIAKKKLPRLFKLFF